jgi:hypothetical protein
VKFDRIFVEALKHPADDARMDVFRVVEELANPKFEIPLEPTTSWDPRVGIASANRGRKPVRCLSGVNYFFGLTTTISPCVLPAR